ncbi:MAG: hypothetical protein NVS3B6_22920 [Pseudarthrobacter sp.]
MHRVVAVAAHQQILAVLQRDIDEIGFAQMLDDADFATEYFTTMRVFQNMFRPQSNRDGIAGLGGSGANVGADFLV